MQEPWTLKGRRAGSISPFPGSARWSPSSTGLPYEMDQVRSSLGPAGWLEGGVTLASCCLPVSWGSLLPSLLSRSCSRKAAPEGHSFPPAHKAAVSFGSFCGLGLLFLSTVVRKPLPQKASAGGLVYRAMPPGLRVSHPPPPRDKEWSHQPGLPFQLLAALGQALHLSVPFHQDLVRND